MVGLGPHGELPWGVFRRRTYLPGGTGTTGGPVKADPQYRITGDVVAWGPFDTGMALGPTRLLGVPIQHKGLQVLAVFELMLPAIGSTRRADHIDLVLLLRGHQKVGIHIAAVE